MKEKIIQFIKKETVLVIAAVLAVVSSFFVKPSVKYLDYIDWRVLGILLSLMIVMAGLQKNGLFDAIGKKLLKKTKNTLQLSLVLVYLCFFFSMLITNDVALLTFVPFAMYTLKKSRQEKLLIPVIVLQTLAANLGSMLTPVGNPQNLYLYHLSGMSMKEFLLCMLPYTLASGILLLVVLLWIGREKEKITVSLDETGSEDKQQSKYRSTHKNLVYITLFLMSLLVVVRIFPYYAVLAITVLLVFYMDRSVLKKVDYCLLLTFISFFIFTGNIGNISVIQEGLQNIVSGRELGIGILTSQVISNVPAALLLSGFTENYRALLAGVNIGGLGTLIASMASLISYKIFVNRYQESRGKYFFWFTVASLAFLAALVLLAVVIS